MYRVNMLETFVFSPNFCSSSEHKISVPPCKVYAPKTLKRDMSQAVYSKSSEETRLLYMIIRFNIGFYLHIDQQT